MRLMAGVHLPNDGKMTGDELQRISGLRLVKGLLRLDNGGRWDELDWRELAGHLRGDCVVVLRLFFPGRLEAAEFVRRARERLGAVLPVLAPREVLVEIHNEPNHFTGIEGWGQHEEQAEDFREWYHEVLNGLVAGGLPVEILGWPGLALSEWCHGERTWALVNRANIRRSGWVGVHCYWQQPGQLDHLQLGGNWRWYRRRWPNKRIIVTECANSWARAPGVPWLNADEQAREYTRWCHLANRGRVDGVAFFLMGGTDDWAAFRLFPETVQALARLG